MSARHALLIGRPVPALTPVLLTAGTVEAVGLPMTGTACCRLPPTQHRVATLHTLVVQTFLAVTSFVLAASTVRAAVVKVTMAAERSGSPVVHCEKHWDR